MEEFIYQLIKKHEGWRRRVYVDTKGNPTVGVGFNLNAAGARAMITYVGADYARVRDGSQELTDLQVSALYARSLLTAESQSRMAVPNYALLPLKVQAVVTDMIFNLGLSSFLEFSHFIAALGEQDFKTAAYELKRSLWYSQVGVRGAENYNLVTASVPPSPATVLEGETV